MKNEHVELFNFIVDVWVFLSFFKLSFGLAGFEYKVQISQNVNYQGVTPNTKHFTVFQIFYFFSTIYLVGI